MDAHTACRHSWQIFGRKDVCFLLIFRGTSRHLGHSWSAYCEEVKEKRPNKTFSQQKNFIHSSTREVSVTQGMRCVTANFDRFIYSSVYLLILPLRGRQKLLLYINTLNRRYWKSVTNNIIILNGSED